jgi:hypothetical protein
MTSSTPVGLRAHLFLGNRPRLEIPLPPSLPGTLPVWLTVDLPGPQSTERPEGRFRADPRIPESAIEFRWSEALAVPSPVAVLTITVGDESWTLEQDLRHPDRWLAHADADRRRHWS